MKNPLNRFLGDIMLITMFKTHQDYTKLKDTEIYNDIFKWIKFVGGRILFVNEYRSYIDINDMESFDEFKRRFIDGIDLSHTVCIADKHQVHSGIGQLINWTTENIQNQNIFFIYYSSYYDDNNLKFYFKDASDATLFRLRYG